MTQLSHMRNFNKKKKRISKINADTLLYFLFWEPFPFFYLFTFLPFYLLINPCFLSASMNPVLMASQSFLVYRMSVNT